ncbi:MAG: WYL domain-containing protein [Pseudomonadales bacterium]
MDKFDRIQLLHRFFKHKKLPASLLDIAEELECSTRTVQRTIDQMRIYLNAPIEYDRSQRGYCYRGDLIDMFELPGTWLTAEELQSLATLLHLLNSMGSNLLKEELSSVEGQINRLLVARGLSVEELKQRVKFLPMAIRTLDSHIFTRASEALLNRQQLDIHYRSYSHQQTRRRISPQTLIYYRENWYLDAWCHLRKALRTFSIARIEKAELSTATAKKISTEQQQQHFAQSFGIFSGKAKHQARLRFFPAIAREIASQQWHPEQQSEWEGEDYILSFPYSDERELVQDILRHIPSVVVEAPAKLKKSVQNRLYAGLEVFNSA